MSPHKRQDLYIKNSAECCGMVQWSVLQCFAMPRVAVCCSVLQWIRPPVCCNAVCSVLCCSVLQCSVVMFSIAECYKMLPCVRPVIYTQSPAVCCSLLRYGALQPVAMQRVAACCSVLDLPYILRAWQCVAVCCGVSRCVAACCSATCCSMLQCIRPVVYTQSSRVCCSMLQRVAAQRVWARCISLDLSFVLKAPISRN